MVSYSTRHIFVDNGNVLSAGTTYYAPIQGGCNFSLETNEAYDQCVIRAALTSAYLFVKINANSIAATSTVLSRHNGANGNLTVSINSNATGTFEDLTDSDALASGDTYDYSLVLGGSSGTLTLQFIGIVLSSAAAQTTEYVNSKASATTQNPGTVYMALCGLFSTSSSTEAYVQKVVRCSGLTLSNLRAYVDTNTDTVATTVYFRKNGSNGNQSLSIAAGTTGAFEDTTDTDTAANGDLICYRWSTGGSGGVSFTILQMLAVASHTGAEMVTAGNIGSINYGSTRYYVISGQNGSVGTAITMRFVTTLTHLYVYISSNTINSGNSTLKVWKNGAAGNGNLSIGYGTTGAFEDTTDSDNFVATDNVMHQLITSGTSGTLGLGVMGITSLDPQPVSGSGSGSGVGKAANEIITAGAGHGSGLATTSVSQVITPRGAGSGLGAVMTSLQYAKGLGRGSAAGKSVNTVKVQGNGLGSGSGTVKLSQIAKCLASGSASAVVKITQVAKGVAHGSASAAVKLSQAAIGLGSGRGSGSVLLAQIANGLGRGSALAKATNQVIVSGAGSGRAIGSVGISQVVKGLASGSARATVAIIRQAVQGFGRGSAVGTVFRGFMGLIGKPSSLVRAHLTSSAVRQHKATGEEA